MSHRQDLTAMPPAPIHGLQSPVTQQALERGVEQVIDALPSAP